MNKIKKIIVVTVTVFICASIGIFIMCNINKNENTIIKKNFGSLMSEVLNNSEVYGLYNVDFTNIEILNEVIINDVESEKIKTIFYGCSCCETDTYLETYSKPLMVGDEVSFENISPYSYQWNTSFNGVDKMKFVFKLNDKNYFSN